MSAEDSVQGSVLPTIDICSREQSIIVMVFCTYLILLIGMATWFTELLQNKSFHLLAMKPLHGIDKHCIA